MMLQSIHFLKNLYVLNILQLNHKLKKNIPRKTKQLKNKEREISHGRGCSLRKFPWEP